MTGLLIGALITGGIGGFPAAFVGAFQGFTLATGTALAGGCISFGGTLLFFSNQTPDEEIPLFVDHVI